MVRPDYAGAGLLNLIASLVESRGGRARHPTLELLPPAEIAAARNVLLLIVDGLGDLYVTRRAYDDLAGLVRATEAAVKSGNEPKFVYVYWPLYDTVSHVHGARGAMARRPRPGVREPRAAGRGLVRHRAYAPANRRAHRRRHAGDERRVYHQGLDAGRASAPAHRQPRRNERGGNDDPADGRRDLRRRK